MAQQDVPVWLFVSYGAGHVKALLPVAQRVRELGLARPVYLALTSAAAAVRPTGIPVLGFKDVMTASDLRARAWGEALADQLAVQAAEREESVAYLGLSYVDLEDRLGPELAAENYDKYGRQAFLPLGVLQRILQACRPALVVATNSPRAEQAAIQTARSMGVPSVCLLDLLGIWERDLLAQADYANAVCVLNPGVRQFLIDAGRAPADVHVTGNPAFDTLADPALKALGRHLRQQAGWCGLHVCLYAASPEPQSIPGVAGHGDPEWPRRIEQQLIALVSANPTLALWVRRHPGDAAPEHLTRLAHPRIRVSGPDMPLHACLHACDEVVVTVSTVGVEAHLAGKRVTQVRGSILDHLSPYLALKLADRELTLAQLAHAWDTPVPAPDTTPLSTSLLAETATDCVVQVLQTVVRNHPAR